MNKKLKIIVVGAGDYPIYERALYDAFKELGYTEIKLVTWNKVLKRNNSFWKLLSKIETRYATGIQTLLFNKHLLDICYSDKPDIVFLYSCRLVYPNTVSKLQSNGIYVASYCNDDPFSDKYRDYFWKNYKNSLKFCNINYVYRHSNIKDVENITGIPGKLLRAYYIEKSNYICSKEELLPDVPDVIFLGHIENDERLDYLDALLGKGIKLGLNELAYGEWAKGKDNVVFLENPREWYNRYLCSCKIPLVFLSKINRDTYTRRCFEIPAAGALLFCPYTEDLASMFDENREIIFYRSKEDFVSKTMYYLQHDEERRIIASNGHKRLLNDGHEIKDRARTILVDYWEKKQHVL